MDSTTETTPSGNDKSAVTSPPADSSTSTPGPDSSPQSPPPSNSSPPPRDSSSSSPPPPESSSPPPPDSSGSSSPSPPPPESNSSPSPPPPPTTSTPAQSPPPNNPASPPPAHSGTPTPPTTPPAGPGISPPPPGAVPSRTPPSPVLSPSRPRPPSTSTSSASSSQANVSKSSSADNTSIAVVAGAIGGVVLLLAAITVCLICLRKKKKKRYYMEGELPQRKAGKYHMNQNRPSPLNHNIINNTPSPGLMGTPRGSWGGVALPSSEFNQSPKPYNKSEFTYEELAAATGGFSQANVLGQGGFGFVHKGVLPSGVEVAVKSLKAGSGQGEREFQAEVDIISRVHHRHLVSLVGYCIAGQQRMLVYQFVPNKTLEFHLHGKGNPVMDWGSRLRISIGSAKGLAYLHEDCQPRIIHRDIKAANILLDFNFEAMVADFGLAKLTSDNFTHVSTRVMGTFGYLAPEYAASGKLTEKSDVFSFGVMLLELITGRRPVDPARRVMDDSLVDWARPLLSKVLEEGNYNELVDPRLEDNYDPHEMARMVACASASIRHSARRRPKMSQIVRTLEGASSLDDLNEKPPPNVPLSPAKVPMSSSVYDTRAYNADIVKFRQMIQDGSSSEYGATTSEYGLNPSSSSSDSKETNGSSTQKEIR